MVAWVVLLFFGSIEDVPRRFLRHLMTTTRSMPKSKRNATGTRVSTSIGVGRCGRWNFSPSSASRPATVACAPPFKVVSRLVEESEVSSGDAAGEKKRGVTVLKSWTQL